MPPGTHGPGAAGSFRFCRAAAGQAVAQSGRGWVLELRGSASARLRWEEFRMVQGSGPDQGLVVHVGPLKIDVPRSLGYYGGIAVAVGVGVIDPPLALFIAAIPAMKMLMNSQAPTAMRFIGQVFDGAAQPLGGDAQGTVRLDDDDAAAAQAKKDQGRAAATATSAAATATSPAAAATIGIPSPPPRPAAAAPGSRRTRPATAAAKPSTPGTARTPVVRASSQGKGSGRLLNSPTKDPASPAPG